jgi:hypothetical protein
MRLVYYQTHGGGLVRWFSVTPSGEQVLINDPEHPLALRAFRTTSGTTTPSPRITTTRNGNSMVLSWTGGGTLETSSTMAAGSWTAVQNGTSPYTVQTTGANAFYRVRQ